MFEISDLVSFFLFYSKRCFNSSKLTGFTTDRGILTVDGLFHEHPNSATDAARKYRITFHFADGTNMTKDSYPFRVDGLCYFYLF